MEIFPFTHSYRTGTIHTSLLVAILRGDDSPLNSSSEPRLQTSLYTSEPRVVCMCGKHIRQWAHCHYFLNAVWLNCPVFASCKNL